jgi:uncharacterized membrane protein YidH (DUF202 family)
MNDGRRQVIDWDDGVASERTVLAWERTAIASLAVAVLVLRAGIIDALLGLAIPVTALLVLAGAVEWLFSRNIYLGHDQSDVRGGVIHPRAIFILAAVTLAAAAASLALALAS